MRETLKETVRGFNLAFERERVWRRRELKKKNNNNLANLGKCEILLIEHVLSIHKATNKKH